MKKKLLIWDFDGVIADTEKLWLKNRQKLLKDYMNVDWDFTTVEKHLKGMSDITKREVLDSLGIITDDYFWEKSIQMDLESMYTIGFELTKDIEEIFKLNIKQCIATGGMSDKTAKKIDVVKIRNYFPNETVFTADMVKRGKPEPDLFLLAAEKMGYKPHDCIVIEDSVVGIKAAIQAGMNPVAFVKYNTNERIKEIKNMGLKNIFYDMKDIRNFLINIV